MKTRKVTTAAFLTSCVVAVGCASEAKDVQIPEVQTLELQPDLTIGVIDGDSEYEFGDIVSIASDSVGHIYVGDRIGASIRVYDRTGQYVSQIAREGGGPGEISGWPADIALGPNSAIYVRDGVRITIFVPREVGAVADSVAAVWPGHGSLASSRGRIDNSGTYYFPNGLFRFGQTPRFFYIPIRNGSPTGDTLEVPSQPGLAGRRPAIYRLGPSDARMFQGLSHVPFAPLPTWDVTNAGTLLSSSGGQYALPETDLAGDTLRLLSGSTNTSLGIPPAERADSARALSARLDSLPVPIAEIDGVGEGVAERLLPEALPALIAAFVAADGSIWIEHWPPERQHGSRFYDVLDDEGRLSQRVVLHAPLMRDPSPFFGVGHVVGVVRDDTTGVERVVRFTIAERPNRLDEK